MISGAGNPTSVGVLPTLIGVAGHPPGVPAKPGSCVSTPPLAGNPRCASVPSAGGRREPSPGPRARPRDGDDSRSLSSDYNDSSEKNDRFFFPSQKHLCAKLGFDGA